MVGCRAVPPRWMRGVAAVIFATSVFVGQHPASTPASSPTLVNAAGTEPEVKSRFIHDAVRRAPRRSQRVVARSEIERIIVAAARKYGIDERWFLAVARCESGLRPRARSAHGMYLGLFQFDHRSWRVRSMRAGFGGAPWWDPVANAGTAAWLWKTSGPGHWPVCSRRYSQ